MILIQATDWAPLGLLVSYWLDFVLLGNPKSVLEVELHNHVLFNFPLFNPQFTLILVLLTSHLPVMF